MEKIIVFHMNIVSFRVYLYTALLMQFFTSLAVHHVRTGGYTYHHSLLTHSSRSANATMSSPIELRNTRDPVERRPPATSSSSGRYSDVRANDGQQKAPTARSRGRGHVPENESGSRVTPTQETQPKLSPNSTEGKRVANGKNVSGESGETRDDMFYVESIAIEVR